MFKPIFPYSTISIEKNSLWAADEMVFKSKIVLKEKNPIIETLEYNSQQFIFT